VTTPQIYKGSIAFIVLQLIMVAVIIAVPSLVTGGIDQGAKVDADQALETMGVRPPAEAPAMPSLPGRGARAPVDDAAAAMKALQEAVNQDAASGKKP
jgi:hypothetical protein